MPNQPISKFAHVLLTTFVRVELEQGFEFLDLRDQPLGTEPEIVEAYLRDGGFKRRLRNPGLVH
jgi:hypothetical protein